MLRSDRLFWRKMSCVSVRALPKRPAELLERKKGRKLLQTALLYSFSLCTQLMHLCLCVCRRTSWTCRAWTSCLWGRVCRWSSSGTGSCGTTGRRWWPGCTVRSDSCSRDETTTTPRTRSSRCARTHTHTHTDSEMCKDSPAHKGIHHRICFIQIQYDFNNTTMTIVQYKYICPLWSPL